MVKVVYNACYGGFGLSDKAMQRYAELAGFKLYPYEHEPERTWTIWIKCPREQYDKLNAYSRGKMIFTDSNLSRTDPLLVQVVEELGDKANGSCARLVIEELEPGTRYRITEYDGSEDIETDDSIDWEIA